MGEKVLCGGGGVCGRFGVGRKGKLGEDADLRWPNRFNFHEPRRTLAWAASRVFGSPVVETGFKAQSSRGLNLAIWTGPYTAPKLFQQE